MPAKNSQRAARGHRQKKTSKKQQQPPGQPPLLFFGSVRVETPEINLHPPRKRANSLQLAAGGVNVQPTSLGRSSRAAMESVSSLASASAHAAAVPVPFTSRNVAGVNASNTRTQKLLKTARKIIPPILKKPSLSIEADSSSQPVGPRRKVSFTSPSRSEAGRGSTIHNPSLSAAAAIPIANVSTPRSGPVLSKRSSFAILLPGSPRATQNAGAARPLLDNAGPSSSSASSKKTRQGRQSFFNVFASRPKVDATQEPTAASQGLKSRPCAEIQDVAVVARERRVVPFVENENELQVVAVPDPAALSSRSSPGSVNDSQLGSVVVASAYHTTVDPRSASNSASSIMIPTLNLVQDNQEFRLSETCMYWVHEHLVRFLWVQAESRDNRSIQRILQQLRWTPTTDLDIGLPPALASLLRSLESRNHLLQLAERLGIPAEDVVAPIQADRAAMRKCLANYQTTVLERPALHERLLNVVQDIISRQRNTESPKLDFSMNKLLIKLSFSCEKLPTSLFVDHVENQTGPVAGGGFGDIHRGEYRGCVVALKRLRLYDEDEEDKMRKKREKFYQEALMWKNLDHPHILPFMGLYCDESVGADRPLQSLFLVCPWMKNGTVCKYIERNPDVAIERLLLEVAHGVEHLHDQMIVHGDLRGDNILVDDGGHVLLADFGLASYVNTTRESTARRGSTRWMAPELLQPEPGQIFRRTFQSDVYSFACVCYELYNGAPPFSDSDTGPGQPVAIPDTLVLLKVIAGSRPFFTPKFPLPIRRLVEDCWRQEPQRRLRAPEIVHRLVAIRQDLVDRRDLSRDPASGLVQPYRPPRSRSSSLAPEPSTSRMPSRAPSLNPSLLQLNLNNAAVWNSSTSSLDMFVPVRSVPLSDEANLSTNWRNPFKSMSKLLKKRSGSSLGSGSFNVAPPQPQDRASLRSVRSLAESMEARGRRLSLRMLSSWRTG